MAKKQDIIDALVSKQTPGIATFNEAATNEQLESLLNQLSIDPSELNNLRVDYETLKAEANALKSAAESLKSENETLKGDMSKLNEDLSKAEAMAKVNGLTKKVITVDGVNYSVGKSCKLMIEGEMKVITDSDVEKDKDLQKTLIEMGSGMLRKV